MTVRHLESMLRMSEAHAKMHLRYRSVLVHHMALHQSQENFAHTRRTTHTHTHTHQGLRERRRCERGHPGDAGELHLLAKVCHLPLHEEGYLLHTHDTHDTKHATRSTQNAQHTHDTHDTRAQHTQSAHALTACSLARAQQKFRGYISFKRDNEELLLHLLQTMVRERSLHGNKKREEVNCSAFETRVRVPRRECACVVCRVSCGLLCFVRSWLLIVVPGVGAGARDGPGHDGAPLLPDAPLHQERLCAKSRSQRHHLGHRLRPFLSLSCSKGFACSVAQRC